MSLRIPLSRDQTLAVEFHEIERRLRKLERSTGVSVAHSTIIATGNGNGSGTSVDLTGIQARLDALEATVSALVNVDDTSISVFGGVGPSSAEGTVPAPGVPLPPTGLAEHVLLEDASWGYPLRGLVQVATSGEDTAQDMVNVEGHLQVLGTLSSGEVVTDTAKVIGFLLLNGNFGTCEDDLSVAGLI